MGRLKMRGRDELSAKEQQLYDRIAAQRGAVRGPFNAWLYSPDLCDKVEAFGKFVRFESDVPMNLKEVAVLVVAHKFRSNYVWQAHERFALKHGVSQEVIDSIRGGHLPNFPTVEERKVYNYALEMMTDHHVSDATWQAMVEMLGEKRLVEFTAFIGNFSMVCLAVNAFAVDMPEGVAPAFT